MLGKILRRAKRVRAASIGCGPASELFGLCLYRDYYKMEYSIEYDGFEKIDDIWKPIHNEIKKMDVVDTINFHYCNVFDYYDGSIPAPNLLILNYVISDIVRQSSTDEIDQFINSLIALISSMSPKSFILLNDINLGRNEKEARYYYPIIISQLTNAGIRTKPFEFHFPSSRPHYQYGYKAKSNSIVQTIPEDIVGKYDPWDECRSAALILRKEN